MDREERVRARKEIWCLYRKVWMEERGDVT